MGGEGRGAINGVCVSESGGDSSNKAIGGQEGGVCLWKDTQRKSGGGVAGPRGRSLRGGWLIHSPGGGQ